MIGFEMGKWEGLDGMGEEELKKLRAPAERAVRRASRHFVNETKRTLAGSRSGRVYPIGHRGRTYQASSPGEAPASRTGKLRQSITSTEPKWVGDNVEAEVGSALPYARRMEFGGAHVTRKTVRVQVRPGVWRVVKAGTIIRILPRPFFETTFVREERRLEAILEGTVK